MRRIIIVFVTVRLIVISIEALLARNTRRSKIPLSGCEGYPAVALPSSFAIPLGL